MRSLRSLLGISYKDHVTNEEVRNRVAKILSIVKAKKPCRWYGHVTRSNGLAKTVLQGTVPGVENEGDKKENGLTT